MKTLALSDKILVELLGITYAANVPNRRFDLVDQGNRTNAGTNAYCRRLLYRETGIPWASGATTSTGRIDAMRALADLAEDGLVTVVKAGQRTTHVRLTDGGEIVAQVLSVVPTLLCDVSWALFNAIMARGGAYVPEDDLIGTWTDTIRPEGERTRLEALDEIQHALVPFLSRQWLASGSTCHRNARYWPGPLAGEAVKPTGLAIPSVTDAEARAGRKAFLRAFDAAYVALGTDEADDPQELGCIPLAACGG